MLAQALILSPTVDALSGTTPLFLSDLQPRVRPPASGQMLRDLTVDYIEVFDLDCCQ